MADGDGLENHCGGNVTVGSNPTPSAQDRLWIASDLKGAEVELELLNSETAEAYLTLAAIVGDGLAWPRRVPGRSGLP